MNLLTLSISTLLIIFAAAIHITNSEQLSTTFVLDTSDSDSSTSDNPEPSASSVPKPTLRSLEDKNTRIITDDSNENHSSSSSSSSGSSNTNNKLKLNNQTSHNTQQTNRQPTTTHNPTHQQQAATSNQQQQHAHNNQNQTATSPSKRTLQQDESTVHRHTTNNSGSSSNQQHNHNHQQKSTSTTTTTTTTTTSSLDSDTPKNEERLLISITSNHDDDHYSKPQKAGSQSGYGEDTSLHVPSSSSSSSSQHPHQPNKRKPSITISIQDANINKQNGGSSPAAVIVRPGEDGQSIVISTVGSANAGTNKYKPGEGISVPLGSNSNIQHQQQQPYREPINNPIQSIIAQHQTTSTTTRRPPPLNEDYQTNNNRPITSTLVDQQRPPHQQLADERPQRPIQTNLDDHSSANGGGGGGGYETPRPDNSQNRPTTNAPSEPPYSGSSYNDNTSQNGGLSPSSSSNNYEQQQQANSNNDQYASSELKFPLNEKNCGVMHETRIVGGEEADPDDFMWMAAIIKSRPKDGEPRPFCGGSLITRRHILTAAHCLEGLAPRDVLIRLGSYDFDDSASSSSADYAIDQFRVPAQYSKKTHVADIAIMRLKTPLSSNDNYKTVCMPQPRRSYVGALGTVTGYGSQSQTFRRAAPKLRQVTVPIWENRKCSVVYKKNLTDSFLCAGYEEGGKDACQGDSGGPLMTEGPDQKMMIVGVVSHGIGCGSPGYPGVYTRTTTFTDWIEKNTRE